MESRKESGSRLETPDFGSSDRRESGMPDFGSSKTVRQVMNNITQSKPVTNHIYTSNINKN